MNPKSFMIIAGEASSDLLAAELVGALRERVLQEASEPTEDVQPLRTQLVPHFFGAGGPQMAKAGVELAFDLTQHSVIGFFDVLKNLIKFRRLFQALFRFGIGRMPDAIIGVDYGGFNLRLGKAIKRFVRRHRAEFRPWNPRIVQYISPQVWASRPDRAYTLAENYDLLLSIFPFEQEWYAKRVPRLRVEFVGHPMVERFRPLEIQWAKPETAAQAPLVLLLPGSRERELRRHLPVMFDALRLIQEKISTTQAKMVLPNDTLVQLAKSRGVPPGVNIQIGNLPQALNQSDLAIASTGTVTLECAYFGVPAVTLYKLSWGEYQFAKRIVTVQSATMPNLLAGEEVYPEFIQHAATAENIARAAVELWRDGARRQSIRTKLRQVVASLGGPGAANRAAAAILKLLQ